MSGEGVNKLVYGLKKVSQWVVEVDCGKVIRRPSPPYPSDCRGCSLLDIVCEELEYPCRHLIEKCGCKDCEECSRLAECLDEKPCCWECEYLTDCLEMVKGYGDEALKQVFGCDAETFVEAVEMLAGVT